MPVAMKFVREQLMAHRAIRAGGTDHVEWVPLASPVRSVREAALPRLTGKASGTQKPALLPGTGRNRKATEVVAKPPANHQDAYLATAGRSG